MEIVENAGIAIGIIGMILVYKYGISPNYKKGSTTYLYTSEELKTKKIEEAKKEKHYQKMKWIGFIMSVIAMLIPILVRILK